MKTLDRTLARSQTWLTTLTGTRFRGSIMPASEGALPTDTFAEARLVLRVRRDEPVKAADVIIDGWDRKYLVAEHDQHFVAGKRADRVFKLFRMTDLLSWKRLETTKDPVTGQARGSSEKELGPIWCALETYGREQPDYGLRVSEDRQRIITGYPIQLNDKIHDATVRRLTSIFGIWVAEVQ
jgi:hypothetical protein